MNNEELFARSTQLSSDGTIESTSREGANIATPSTSAAIEREALSTNATQDTTPSVISSQPNRPSTTTMVGEFDSIIERFRKGEITKSQTIKSITTKLAFDLNKDEPGKDNALQQYLITIDSIERLSNESIKRGARITSGLGGHRGAPRTTVIDADEACTSNESPNPDKGKRRRNGNESEDEDTDGEDDDGESNKKKRLFEKNMPWFQRESMARITANPSCNQTREILSTFRKDFNIVKQWISTSQIAPRGFPIGEWEHIIKGRPVDLDVVLSSLHHVSPVKESIGRVGQTEISLGRTEPVRRVNTSGEWTSAWNATIKAYIFTFPHREQELRAYGDYIDREFSAKVVSAHRKIILYDAAVRNEVGGGQSILLTDREHFSYIYSAIIMPDGIETEYGRNSYKPGNSNKHSQEICRRFNSTSGCPNTANSCRYQHSCSKCKRKGHGSKDCEAQDGKA